MEVILTGGEPLVLGDKLIDIIQKIKAEDISVTLFTNGDLMNEEMAEKLTCCDSIVLTMTDSKNAMIGEDSFEHVMKSIALLKEVKIEVRILFTNHILKQVEEIMSKLSHYKNIKSIGVMPFIDTGRQDMRELIVTQNDYNEFIIEMAELISDYKDDFQIYYVDDSNDLKNVIRNKQFYFTVYIQADGEVLVNQWLRITAGNLLKESLLDIWNLKMKNFYYKAETRDYFMTFRNLNEEGNEYVRKDELIPIERIFD